MQTVSTPTTSSKWQQLVARMPRPDPEDKILQDIEEGQVEKIVAELQAGGHEAVVALVEMLHEPERDRTDSPARHALHALVMHAGGLGDGQRRAVAAALASSLHDREQSRDVKLSDLSEEDRQKVADAPDPERMLTFAEAVKQRKQPGGHAEAAHRAATLLHLANIAIRVGRKIRFDPVKEQIIGDEEANRLAYQPMRAPWHL